jgi:hypothetical protein
MSHILLHALLDGKTCEGNKVGPEVARILRGLADFAEKADRGTFSNQQFYVHDSAGNKIGKVSFGDMYEKKGRKDEEEEEVPFRNLDWDNQPPSPDDE